MNSRWKRWLAAGSVLLLAGAGCASNVSTEADLNADAGGEMRVEEPGTDVDVAVDAYLEGSEEAAAREVEESKDAEEFSSDAELNAFSDVYAENEL